jgi:hypothetical protein
MWFWIKGVYNAQMSLVYMGHRDSSGDGNFHSKPSVSTLQDTESRDAVVPVRSLHRLEYLSVVGRHIRHPDRAGLRNVWSIDSRCRKAIAQLGNMSWIDYHCNRACVSWRTLKGVADVF